MEEGLKLLLQQINNNISELRSDHNKQVENINVKIDSKISELRNLIDSLTIKLNEIQKETENIKELKEEEKKEEEEEEIEEGKKESLSLQKTTLIVGCISAVVTGLTTAAIQITEMIVK